MDPQWVDVGAADEIEEAVPLSVDVDGLAVLILRCGADLYAIEDRCTHDGEPLQGGTLEDCRIVCPRHGAQFCVRTGEALTPPAYEPVRTFRVRAAYGRVLLDSTAAGDV